MKNFIIGIQPNVTQKELSFSIANGFLVDAIIESKNVSQYLLLIDEINRADLGKVLGESIALFEYQEVKMGKRKIQLPYKNLDLMKIRYPIIYFYLEQ